MDTIPIKATNDTHFAAPYSAFPHFSIMVHLENQTTTKLSVQNRVHQILANDIIILFPNGHHDILKGLLFAFGQLNNFNAFEVKVGEAVSFNEVVGARTALRGYKEATVYYGATITEGVGGGICQASSTLYAAVLQAGMDVIERHAHTMVVAYCKASMDAAVSEDAQDDFVFVNNTDYNIYIYTDVTRDYAIVPFKLAKGVVAYIAHDVVGNAVVYSRGKPLCKRGSTDKHRRGKQQP